MELRILSKMNSVNKACVGDIYEIDDNLAICTQITNRYVYVDGKPFPKKQVNKLVREFIYQYNRGKAIFLDPNTQTA